jgi:hypothetical protein
VNCVASVVNARRRAPLVVRAILKGVDARLSAWITA